MLVQFIFRSILLTTRSSANSFIGKLVDFPLAACAGDDLELDLDEFVEVNLKKIPAFLNISKRLSDRKLV